MDNKINNDTDILTVYKLEAIDYIEGKDSLASVEKMLIGFFSSIDACAETERDYKSLPGFSQQSCEFLITPFVFSSVDSGTVKRVFYESYEENEMTNAGGIQNCEIGLFLSREEAETAKTLFLSNLDSGRLLENHEQSTVVYIEEYQINQRYWQEGYSRYSY